MLDWIFLVSLAHRLIWTSYFLITKIMNANQTVLFELGKRIPYMCTMQSSTKFCFYEKSHWGGIYAHLSSKHSVRISILWKLGLATVPSFLYNKISYDLLNRDPSVSVALCVCKPLPCTVFWGSYVVACGVLYHCY